MFVKSGDEDEGGGGGRGILGGFKFFRGKESGKFGGGWNGLGNVCESGVVLGGKGGGGGNIEIGGRWEWNCCEEVGGGGGVWWGGVWFCCKCIWLGRVFFGEGLEVLLVYMGRCIFLCFFRLNVIVKKNIEFIR